MVEHTNHNEILHSQKNHEDRIRDSENLGGSSSNYDIQKLLRGIQRHNLLILLATLLGSAIGLYFSYRLMSTYEADAIVLYQEERFIPPSGGNVLPTLTLPTVLDLIQSPANFAAVKKILGSDDSLKSMVEVPMPRGNSNFIHIIARGKNPLLAVDVANTLATTAVKSAQDFTKKQLLVAMASYKNQLTNVTNRLNSQLKDIEDFKFQNQYFEMNAELLQFTNVVNNSRIRLENASLNYNGLLAEYESLLAAVAQIPDEIPLTLAYGQEKQTPEQSRIFSLQNAISDARLKYSSENPRLIALEHELEELQIKSHALDAKSNDKNNLVENPVKKQLQLELLKMDARLKSSKQTQEDLQAYYDKSAKQLENLPAKQVAFVKLLSAKNLTEEELKSLTDLVDTTQLMINWPRGNLETYELAENAAPRASWLTGLLLTLLGGGLGSLLGVGVAFLREMGDIKFHTARQIELNYSIPCLSVIPELSGLNAKNARRKTIFFIRGIVERIEKIGKRPLALTPHPIIGIGSSISGEGKNLLSHLLAQYYQRIGKQVVLIEADPQATAFFNPVPPKITLEDFLKNPTDIEGLIIDGPIDRISINPTADPSLKELLKSKAMEGLLNQLREMYEVIIIDIPGVIDHQYAIDLYTFCDLRLFIINSNITTKHIVDESINYLNQCHLTPHGIILNQALRLFITDQRTLNELDRIHEGFWQRWFSRKEG